MRAVRSFVALSIVVSLPLVTACRSNATPDTSTTAPPASVSAPVAVAKDAAAPSEGVLRLGSAIDEKTPTASLAEIAKTPDAFTGKTFTTTGTVSAVCQHMGCWMEIKDDASQAHIKMAGHAFFVPKTASGRKARVLATLVKAEKEAACEGEGHGDGHQGHEGKMAAAGGGGAPASSAKASAKASEKAGEKPKGCRAEAEAQLGRPLAKLELVAEGVELM